MTSILKVSEIQDPTNSNTALSIDSSGNIATGGRIDAGTSVYAQGSHSTPNPTGLITIDIRQLMSGGAQFTDSDTAIQVPVDGLYMIHYSVLGNSGSGNFQIRVQKNGSDVGSSWTQDTNSSNDGVSKTILQVLQANDKITFVVADGASHGNSQFNNFFVVKLG